MIIVIDYGMGNLRSVQKAFEKLGFDARISPSPDDVRAAEKIVLPGVGAFGDAMTELRARGLAEAVVDEVKKGKPFFGMCLGLQLLFEVSHERGEHRGLGILKGEVVRFDVGDLKVPHMGWNRVKHLKTAPHLSGIPDGAFMYFAHSYYVVPEDDSVVATVTRYGVDFASSVWRDNIFATQFHPEKSQDYGLRILRNFGKL